MSDFYLIESLERYVNGEMLPEEKQYFEQMRASNPEIDKMLAEHKIFMQTLSSYAERKNFRQELNAVHNDLSVNGAICGAENETDGKTISLWQRYRKTTAIAACIAGVTALVISGLISLFSPNNNKIELLSNTTEQLQKNQAYLSSKIKEVTKMPADAVIKSGGSAFLIDGNGFLITNAHVLKGSGAVVVNHEGHEFSTSIMYVDEARDLAVLKITDKDYNPVKYLPYGIKTTEEDMGKNVFTFGYPSNDIAYNRGYISSLKGYEGDTSTISVSLLANPGNSGGPVFNESGDVIGVLGAREANTQGVTFVIKSKEIYRMLSDWRKTSDSAYDVKVTPLRKNNNARANRTELIKKLENYVYNVKAYN
ncbi:hypothetical protein A9P82_01800 [Arachidicoccus ginsenosidimutans]|uniref:S1 family peptidase n=1 Tax=Arachidicoccus sp. BS20 TaxID=1850526 RepID=UPI0007F0D29A|nr:serine protease [Arachidicoccus sp. BS20]ANI88154.1 hypothetical protein A9P82_01800 [Arachidicoccus sp. BS20]